MRIFIGRTNSIQRWVGRVSPSAPGRRGFVCRVRREERSPRGMPNYIGLTAKSAKSTKKGRRHEGHELARRGRKDFNRESTRRGRTIIDPSDNREWTRMDVDAERDSDVDFHRENQFHPALGRARLSERAGVSFVGCDVRSAPP